MRKVLNCTLLLLAAAFAAGQQHDPLRLHLVVLHRTVAHAIPTLAPLVVLELSEDAISREISVRVAQPDAVTDGMSREVSVAVTLPEVTSSAWSRETSVRVTTDTTVPDAVSRELSVEWDPFKPVFAHSREVTVGGARALTVRVEFQDIDPFLAPTTAALTILDPDGGTLVDSTVSLTNGEVTIPAMPRMYLRVYAKSSHWLRKLEVVPHGSSDFVLLSLLNGDCDEDNEVAIGDFALLSAAFGSAEGDPHWNPSADLNGDLEVDIGDFAILSSNFGEVGD